MRHQILKFGKLSLSQMVRFLMVKPIHSDLNLRFNMGVIYLQLIILLMICDVPVDNETLYDRLRESQDQADSVF
jgi:hypothetical protein